MEQDTQDNERFSFVSIAAATANVTRFLNLDEKKHEESESDPASSDGDEEKRKAHSQYIEHRLRDLATFERRAAGMNGVRRKRD